MTMENRRCVLEIQDGNQITGSSNNFPAFIDTHVFQNQYRRLSLYTNHTNVKQSWPTPPRVEKTRLQPTNRKY